MKNLINRHIEPVLREMAESFPVVTVTGPRQSGKSTLAKMTFPDYDYVSLEDIDIRQFAEKDPRDFLSHYGSRVIIDEIQRVPDLLSYIQTHVDNGKKKLSFILTGSNQFEYMTGISQSLAGRTGILKLLPFSYSEIFRGNAIPMIEDIIYKGFYPRIFHHGIKPEQFYASYLETYIERDLRNLINIKNLSLFIRFIQLCAGRAGQILNMNSIANDLGVTNKTVGEWLSVLEASYIIFLLEPYHRNYNKRIIKSPKIYFFDIGLAAHLLNIEEKSQLKSFPLVGNLFENFVIIEFLKCRFNRGRRSNLYYFRDNTGNEVDLVLDFASRPYPVEIKLGKTINPDFFKGLDFFRKITGQENKSALIVGAAGHQTRNGVEIFNYGFIDNAYRFLAGESG